MFLYDLFPEYKVENQDFECKKIISKIDENKKEGKEVQMIDWLKCIAGMSNHLGGDFFIGVEDQSLKLIGFDQKEVDQERNYFNNAINEHLSPRPTYDIQFIPYKIHDKERFIIKIHIEESEIRPIILKYKGIPSIYMHRNGFTNGATYEEIVEMSIKSKDISYDLLPSSTKYHSEDFKDLQNFYRERTKKESLTDKFLESIGFFDKNKVLCNGAELFMDNYSGNKCTVHCSVFRGFTKGDDRIIAINRFDGNLIQSISYIMNFVDLRMNHSFLKLPTGRKNIDAYPTRALFEGVINAIAHRDYFIDGSQISVDMFKDRIEISSPGSFYKGGTISKTYDLSHIISKRRNKLLCDVFVACNAMEASGTGFDKITKAYKDQDDTHKPYVMSTSDHFTLVLPDLTYENGMVDSDYPSLVYPPIENESVHDAKILSFCYRKEHSAIEIAEYLGISSSTYFRNTILKNLIDQNYLFMNKQGNKSVYKTNEEAVMIE